MGKYMDRLGTVASAILATAITAALLVAAVGGVGLLAKWVVSWF